MTIQEARDFLKEKGFFTDNLWHIDDVQMRFKCSDEQAQDVLNKVLTNGATIEYIHEVIELYSGELELQENQN